MPPSPHRLSRRQALQLVETAYMAAATALLWAGLYYLPVGGALFRLALPLPIALLLLRQGWRCGWEGMVVASLLLVALMGPIRGPLVLFPYGALALWLGWGWRSNWSWWLTWGVGLVIGAGGFLVRENLWVLITAAAAGLLERISALLNLGGGPDLLQVQALALGLVVVQNLIYVLALHAVAYWIFPRLQAPIPEPPEALRALVALDPL
jgi:uncharacterized protein YybS (DUF2232 family)